MEHKGIAAFIATCYAVFVGAGATAAWAHADPGDEVEAVSTFIAVGALGALMALLVYVAAGKILDDV